MRITINKEQGSQNWDKAKLEVARIHEKIKNTRENFLHKLTKSISIRWG
nr:transposase [Petrotoga miotherma]